MAYFLWLDDGCDQLIEYAEPNLTSTLKALPLQVERSDVFRIVVLNSIGGIVSVISISSSLDESFSEASNHRTSCNANISSPTVRRYRHHPPPLTGLVA